MDVNRQQTLKLQRLQNEYAELKKNPPQKWSILEINQNENYTIICLVRADNSCPFYGIDFKIKIVVPKGYPKEGTTFYVCDPKKFYHPNISTSTGKICSSALQSKMIDLRSRMSAFLFLLAVPNPDSCLNSEAGELYIADKNAYYKKALKTFRGLNQVKK